MTHAAVALDQRADADLRGRAAKVIPGGMYGHMAARELPPSMPQFFERGVGCRVYDVDGREYLDLMCSWGPVLLGHGHPRVEAAAAEQRAKGNCLNGPAAVMVELAELMTGSVPHADWAFFAKNGTDVTTICVMVARAQTRRGKILAARGAYHGAAPWCNPWPRGLLPEERASVSYFDYNDIESARAAADLAGDDLAGVIVSPFKHDAGHDEELVDPAFARGLRTLCTERGAALILDDVRAGLRIDRRGSWEPIGVQPDLSAWGKSLGNGYPVAATLLSDSFRKGAERVFTTGSYWMSSVPMAAALATLTVLAEEPVIERTVAVGNRLREGIERQAAECGVTITQSGPVQLPNLSFAGDEHFERASVFADEAARRGVYLHPSHNWFISGAMTEADADQALEATDAAMRRVRDEFGEV